MLRHNFISARICKLQVVKSKLLTPQVSNATFLEVIFLSDQIDYYWKLSIVISIWEVDYLDFTACSTTGISLNIFFSQCGKMELHT